MSEIFDRYVSLAGDFDSRVHGAKDWSAPSPCAGWTARDVVAHLVNNHRTTMGLLEKDYEAAPLQIDDDVVTAWEEVTAAMKATLADPEKAGATVASDFGAMPFEQLIGRFTCTDVLIHTWDLARATGQDETLQPEAVAAAYSGLKPLDAMLRVPGIMGARIDTPEGSDLQTQFLNFTGRAV